MKLDNTRSFQKNICVSSHQFDFSNDQIDKIDDF